MLFVLSKLRAMVRPNTKLIAINNPNNPTTALLYYDYDNDSYTYTFCKRMYDETGAFVTPGDCFEEPHCMRIGYACDKQELIDGLAAMGDFIRSLEA